MKKIFTILFVLMWLCTVGADAQKKEKKVAFDRHLGAYASVELGYSQSIAENSSKQDFVLHELPSVGIGLGYNFSHIFGLRVQGGLLSHTSKCSKAVINVLPDVYGDGRYRFTVLSANVSLITNITNIFREYNKDRQVTWSLVAGGGIISTSGFDKEKIGKWNEYVYYPISPEGGSYATGHLGLQCAVALTKPLDLNIEVRGNATSNAYNGVNNGNSLDFYADFMVGLVYHWGKQSEKAYVEPFIDPVLKDRGREETVRRGEEMYTTVPFYLGFHYLNNITMRRVATVADFMKKYTDVRIKVVGHPDLVEGQDESRNLNLASKRADAVKKALVEKFKIDEGRISVDYDNEALMSLRNVGDWIPAVSFIME